MKDLRRDFESGHSHDFGSRIHLVHHASFASGGRKAFHGPPCTSHAQKRPLNLDTGYFFWFFRIFAVTARAMSICVRLAKARQ